jgi:hypothetical protein
MKRTVQYSRGRVRYTGRIDRAAFVAWCQSLDGQSVLEPIISTMRFSLFGKRRAAQRRVWLDLTGTAASGTVAAALQQQVDSYFSRLSTLVYARDLPVRGINLHRLVAVPRLFANSVTDRQIDAALKMQPAFATANGRASLRHWFGLVLINGIETTALDARPTPKRPLPAGRDWIIVGVNDSFEWRVPLQGPAWPGHYYLLELTNTPITRAVRKAAVNTIAEMEATLAGLSRVERNEILRQAGLSLEKLAAKAG